MSKKYQVFISSTYEDLKKEREQVIRAVLEMGHIPVGMEMFSAADEEQWSIITRQIDDADYYAVIVAHRYGSTTAAGISYTEKEYDYAVSKGIPILGFILHENCAWPNNLTESDAEKRSSLDSFKEKVKSRMVNFWNDKNELHAKFSIALMKAFITHPRAGWIKSSSVAGPEVVQELSRLSAENASLRRETEELRIKEREHDKTSLRETIKTLREYKIIAHVRKTPKDWGDEIQTNLLTIFKSIAPKLIAENDTLEMACDIALNLKGMDYYQNWPVPDNFLAEWIADLTALSLIEPSKKKHSVNDQKTYWSLTEFGSEVYKELRRMILDHSLQKSAAEKLMPAGPEGTVEVLPNENVGDSS